jgi:hypothetical protein
LWGGRLAFVELVVDPPITTLQQRFQTFSGNIRSAFPRAPLLSGRSRQRIMLRAAKSRRPARPTSGSSTCCSCRAATAISR